MRGYFTFDDGRIIPEKMVEGGIQLYYPVGTFFTLEDAVARRIFPRKMTKAMKEPIDMLEHLCTLRNPVIAKHPGGLWLVLIGG